VAFKPETEERARVFRAGDEAIAFLGRFADRRRRRARLLPWNTWVLPHVFASPTPRPRSLTQRILHDQAVTTPVTRPRAQAR
jgi:hypothetical protein